MPRPRPKKSKILMGWLVGLLAKPSGLGVGYPVPGGLIMALNRSLRVCFVAFGTLAVLLLLGLFAFYVWPTMYRYDHMGRGSGYTYPVRIHRVSGKAEMLTPYGWHEVKSPRG